VPSKLVIIDTLTAKGKAKLVFVAKDAAVRKGFGTDPSTIQAQLTVAFSNGATAGTFSPPAGDPGWISNQGTVAKFLNHNAPAGSTVTKVSTLKPGSLVKLVAKGLGDAPLDLVGADDPAGPVWAAYCVTSAGAQICMCSSLTDCVYKPIAGGAGAKLLCHTGVGDAACQALAP
jgi:hypothetical protein